MTTTERHATWSQLLAPGRYLGTSAVLAGGVALHAINMFLTAGLLPTAIDEIGGERLYAWSTTIFMIASVISSMLVSRLLAARGPVGAYLVALAPFVVGTLICAVSPTMAVLLVGRAIQGVGGGILTGLGYAVLQAALPQHLWAKATALISAMWGVGTLAGPAIGGIFAQLGIWRFAFVALTVLGVLLAVAVPRVLPRGERTTAREPIPVAALVLLTASTVLVSVASLFESLVHTLLTCAAAAVFLVAFVARERVSVARILPRATYLAGSPLKWVYLTIVILTTGMASEAFTPLFAQRLAGVEPFVAAFLGAAVSLGWSVSMVFAANASTPQAQRRLRVLGPAILGIGLAITGLFQWDGAGTATVVVWFAGLILAGTGIGMAFPHLLVAAMSSSQDKTEAGKAAAGANTVELIAVAFSAAIGGVLVNLGTPNMVHSARYLLFGFAAVALVGCLTARRSHADAGQ